MRIIVQRVTSASVVQKETQEIVGAIDGEGLFLLVGFTDGDTPETVHMLSKEVSKLRVLKDDQDKMNHSSIQKKSPILAVSQFTLYGDTSHGSRPSFAKAMDKEEALVLFNLFVTDLRDLGLYVETGSFGNYMEISADLDGPVTIILEA